MKCGITLAKQQKLLVVEKSNADLQKQLNSYIFQYEELTTSIKNQNKSSVTLSALIDVENTRNTIIKSMIHQKKSQLESLIATNHGHQEALKVIDQQNKILAAKVYEETEKWRAQQQVNERLSQQIKKFHSIGCSNVNIVKTTEKIKKSYECLLRKLAILENKLESHYRYVEVLGKKQEGKKQGIQKEVDKDKGKVEMVKRRVEREKKQQQRAREQQRKPEKKQIKSFDTIVRKKNQILMNSKKR